MSSLVENVNLTFSILTVLGQAVFVLVVLFLLVKKGRGAEKILSRFSRLSFMKLAFGIALLSMLGSLFYSEVAGFTPCILCWYQRIAMYPLVILLGMAAWRRDLRISVYGITLSAIGLFFAVYHYMMQIGVVKESASCEVVGYSVSCAQTFSMHFGYITIPMMAITAFLFIILSLSLANKSHG